MGIKRRKKHLVAAAIALAGVAGGAVVADATNFAGSVGQTAAPVTWPSIAPTCTGDPCNVTLDVGDGTATVADVVNGTAGVPFLGFGVNGAPASLAGSPNSTIKVPLGTTINITLTQSAGGDPIDLSFPSLPAADVVDNGLGSYTVTASAVGTSVFQPGKNPDAPKQIALGLVGVLVVTPAGCADPQLKCAYDGTVYDEEAILATTVLDLEYALSPGTFDMGYFGQSIDPDFTTRRVYHVLNGKAFPDTDVIEAKAGDHVLLRVVNAGVSDSTMGTLGLRQSLLGRNASAYADPQTVISPLVGPGETADVAVNIPADATLGQFYSIMDQGQQMNNGTASGFGGALTFLNVRAASVAGVDGLGASAELGSAVLVGNALQDRAYATDFPTPIGTLSPVLVALPGSPLPAGVLQSFDTWNQASAGGSPTPSAGGLLHAYVLRPTGNADEYQVVFDSGELTVPALSTPGVSEAVQFPTGGVGVQAGDVLAYYGQGVPTDITATGTDVLSYPALVAPNNGDVITLGGVDFPVYPQARTYSFAATVAPYSGTSVLTATGRSSGPVHDITGFQTVVNSGAAPLVGDWSATTVVGPAPVVAISTSVSAVPGQTVWIRVEQDGSLWSDPASIVVPVP